MEQFSYYIKFIASSIVIIGGLLVALRYAKKYQRVHSNKEIKVMDRLALTSQSSILLLEIKGTEYVVGATNQSISLIDKR